MNWSGILRSLLHTKSVLNAGIMFFAGYGAATVIHLSTEWKIMAALVVVIVNQIGLHQGAPGTE